MGLSKPPSLITLNGKRRTVCQVFRGALLLEKTFL